MPAISPVSLQELKTGGWRNSFSSFNKPLRAPPHWKRQTRGPWPQRHVPYREGWGVEGRGGGGGLCPFVHICDDRAPSPFRCLLPASLFLLLLLLLTVLFPPPRSTETNRPNSILMWRRAEQWEEDGTGGRGGERSEDRRV